MKVQVRGTTQMLGNTPVEVMEGLLSLGFMNPSVRSVEEYVAYLETELASRFDRKLESAGDLAERAEAVIRAFAELGQLDVLED
ncbi:MAG: hypothetical protein FWJ73_01755 [Limnochordales bacterium]|nr:hypothetical protein [Bacillota bacterium]